MRDAVICEPLRTPVGRYGGVFRDVPATELAAAGAKLATDAGLVATAHTAPLRTSVWEAVVEAADELDVDAIITGTRSLHGMREALSNALSHALLQHSQRPVLAIPMSPSPERRCPVVARATDGRVGDRRRAPRAPTARGASRSRRARPASPGGPA